MAIKNLDKVKRFQKEMPALMREVRKDIAVTGKNFYGQTFRKQGFTDRVFIPWRRRKDGQSQSRKFGQSNQTISGRAILVKSGELSNSIESRIYRHAIRFSSDLPYAQIHNDGGTINHPGGTPYIVTGSNAVFITKRKATELRAEGQTIKVTKPHPIKIPRRRFLGPSSFLMEMYERRTGNKINQVWRNS